MIRLPATLELGYNHRVTIPCNIVKLLKLTGLVNVRISRVDNLPDGINACVGITSQWRITVPKAIRTKLNVSIGDSVIMIFSEVNYGMVEQNVHTVIL